MIKEILAKIAGSFQPAYDRIKNFDFSPDTKNKINKLWDSLTPNIQKAIWEIVNVLYIRYGKARAEKFVNDTLNSLNG